LEEYPQIKVAWKITPEIACGPAFEFSIVTVIAAGGWRARFPLILILVHTAWAIAIKAQKEIGSRCAHQT
jgi:hypothetical protein